VHLIYFAGMTKRFHEFVIKFVSISKSSRATPAVFIKFGTWTEMYKQEKVYIQKLHEILVPTHPRSSNLKTRTRKYGKNSGRCVF
jgi:SUMO ligase MMS21 Smc5/6 complex component